MHYAVIHGHLEIVKLLLDQIDNDKNPVDRHGKTPLHYAAINGHYEIAKLLLSQMEGEKNPKDGVEDSDAEDSGDEDSATGYTPWYYAFSNNHFDIAELIHNEACGDKCSKSQYMCRYYSGNSQKRRRIYLDRKAKKPKLSYE